MSGGTGGAAEAAPSRTVSHGRHGGSSRRACRVRPWWCWQVPGDQHRAVCTQLDNVTKELARANAELQELRAKLAALQDSCRALEDKLELVQGDKKGLLDRVGVPCRWLCVLTEAADWGVRRATQAVQRHNKGK